MSYEVDNSGPRSVYVPFLRQGQQVGLGDVIKRVTSAVGIKPCQPCIERARWLNERFAFRGRR